MENTKKTPMEFTSVLAKSSRLQAIRKNQAAVVTKSPTLIKQHRPLAAGALSPYVVSVMNRIEVRLESILSSYPLTQRNSFFKIRYGITPGELGALSLWEIVGRLEIDLEDLRDIDCQSSLEKVNYNGEPI